MPGGSEAVLGATENRAETCWECSEYVWTEDLCAMRF